MYSATSAARLPSSSTVEYGAVAETAPDGSSSTSTATKKVELAAPRRLQREPSFLERRCIGSVRDNGGAFLSKVPEQNELLSIRTDTTQHGNFRKFEERGRRKRKAQTKREKQKKAERTADRKQSAKQRAVIAKSCNNHYE